jgi:hypothetical protein
MAEGKYFRFMRFKKPTRKQAILFFQYWNAYKKSKSNPKFERYLLREGEKWSEPCDLYLYQTSIKEIKKFGISYDHTIRSKNVGEKEINRYTKCLAVYTLPERKDALLIESYLKEKLKRPEISKTIIRELANSDELTTSSEKEFHQVIRDALKTLSKDGAKKLIDTMTPALSLYPEGYDTRIDELVKGESVLLWKTKSDKKKGKIIFFKYDRMNIGDAYIKFMCRYEPSRGHVHKEIRKEELDKAKELVEDNWDQLEKQMLDHIISGKFNTSKYDIELTR